ncbi:MAG: ATP-binding cassette domain-containing protein [candidate division NC10 bacterium]|nr:ATP-binding cassette domain-containing protein [candidate division NC10 bacterium]
MGAQRMDCAELLRLQGVHKAFNGRDVLGGVDLGLQACETVSLLGESGSGKSTLLRVIAGLEKPDRGRVVLFGEDICPLRERDLLPFRKRMGMVFQGAALFDSLTVFENIAFPLRLHTTAREGEIRARVAELLEHMGLSGIELRYPAELSGGMKRRVGIARALALKPELVLFDEPTVGLDPNNARMVCELIAEMRVDLCETAIVATHDLQCALARSNWIAFLHQGQILEVASPADFRNSSKPEVQRFLAGALDQFTPMGPTERRAP